MGIEAIAVALDRLFFRFQTLEKSQPTTFEQSQWEHPQAGKSQAGEEAGSLI